MDLAALLSRTRNLYVAQFRSFAQKQLANCVQGATEIKLRLSEESKLFDRVYCVDFIRNDGAPKIVELQPEDIMTFDAVTGALGSSSFSIEHLQWDDVLIRHNLEHQPYDDLSRWFRLWFDPEDERHDPSADLSGAIHSMLLEPSCISIDFGTAPPHAFWEILLLLEAAGATRIEISSSRAEADRLV